MDVTTPIERKESEEVLDTKESVKQTRDTEKNARLNSFMARDHEHHVNTNRGQSNSSFAYGWRKTEVAEDR